MSAIVIEYLAERRTVLPLLTAWFEAEWPEYYGAAGQGNAAEDLLSYCQRGGVPVGLVAFRQGTPCGFAALKAEPFASHPQLSPWAGAAYVVPELRRQGIGSALFAALESEARTLGYARLYCATATSVSLLQRRGWHLLDEVQHAGQPISIFEKAL